MKPITPKQQGKAQAQRNIGALKQEVERMVADALKAGGYEDEVPGVCGVGLNVPPYIPRPELQRAYNQLMSERADLLTPPAPGSIVNSYMETTQLSTVWGWDIILSEGKWDWNFMTVWAFVCWGVAGGLFIVEGFSIWPFFPITAGFWALHLSENGVFERLWQRLKK